MVVESSSSPVPPRGGPVLLLPSSFEESVVRPVSSSFNDTAISVEEKRARHHHRLRLQKNGATTATTVLQTRSIAMMMMMHKFMHLGLLLAPHHRRRVGRGEDAHFFSLSFSRYVSEVLRRRWSTFTISAGMRACVSFWCGGRCFYIYMANESINRKLVEKLRVRIGSDERMWM